MLTGLLMTLVGRKLPQAEQISEFEVDIAPISIDKRIGKSAASYPEGRR
jgi:hypothetical protein